MIVEQHYLECLSQASYLIVDARTKTAAVIDPRRDVDLYVEAAAKHGATIQHVLLTHMHADFVAGHLELHARTGATIHLSARASAEYQHEALADGQALEFGDVRLVALATPGHTPEGLSYVLYDLAEDASTPKAVFTGDTLFIGDVGRPDLMASVGVTAEELARALYASLHEKLMTLPDDTIVYPGHGAGSMCGKSLSTERSSTIGAQRRTNYALQIPTSDEFVATITADQPQAPAYFAFDAELNRKARTTLDDALDRELRALELDDVLALSASGVRILDVRDAESFAAGHLTGSTNVPLGGRFASWVGSLLFEAERLVVVSEPGDERQAAVRLGRVGLDRVEGFLRDGPNAWSTRPELVATTKRVEPTDVARRLSRQLDLQVLDVRNPGEWDAGHVDGALFVPLVELEARVAELPRDRTLSIICGSSYRSSIAASLLKRHGLEHVEDIRGGMTAWQSLGLPVTAPVVS